MGSGVSGPKAVILHRDGFTAGLSLPSCIHICPASQNRGRRPRSHHPASKSATLSKQGPQPTAHLTVNSVPGGQGAEGKKMDDSPPRNRRNVDLSAFSPEACPASGQVASIPEPWASYQSGTGLATVSDFQWHLPHPHFFMAPIKSYLLCTERQNWRCQEWLRAF